MPNMPAQVRKFILKKIFKEGVESVDESVLKKLFSSARPPKLTSHYLGDGLQGKKILRFERDPGNLLKEGFRENAPGPFVAEVEEALSSLGYSDKKIAKLSEKTLPKLIEKKVSKILTYPMSPKWKEDDMRDAKGLYWMSRKNFHDSLPDYNKSLAENKGPNVTGIVNPDAQGEDIFTRGTEIIQTTPNNVLARITKDKKNYYKILGTTAAFGAAGLLSQDDVNAMGMEEPLVESLFKKATKSGLGKAMKKGVVSSASKELEGQLYKDQVIKKVMKGSGDWRYIVLENGDTELVDKKVINSLSRAAGTAKYMEKFDSESAESKLAQAYKSLQMHLPNASKEKELILDYHKNYNQQLKLSGKETPELSLVKKGNTHFSFPTKYAKLLEKEKVLKIIKDLRNE